MAGHARRVWGIVVAGLLCSATGVQAQSFSQDGLIAGGANALYWTRSAPQKGQFLSDGTNTFGPEDLHLGWEPGVEGWVTLQRPDSPWGLDMRYFWMNEFSDTAQRTLVDPVIGAANLGLSLESSLQGAEISATYQANDWLSIIAGFRWLQVKERLETDIDFAALPGMHTSLDFATVNDLYGGQLGANVSLWESEFFRLGLLTKLGLYQNTNSFNYDLVFFGMGPLAFNFPGSDPAFTTDARLAGTWWLTSNISCTAGYQVLLIDGVFRAETQAIDPTFTSLKANDTLLYHGGFVGLTIYRP